MCVHCCHCRWCQRETGAAFAVNALVETANIEMLTGTPDTIVTPSESGRGQRIIRCPSCKVAVWSHYSGNGEILAFVRVGTLDTPELAPPDIHIFTASKQPWVVIPDDVPAMPEYYDRRAIWRAENVRRFAALTGTL